MDIPVLLEHLNDFQQNATDLHEIHHFTQNLKTLIEESSTNLRIATSDNTMINRVNNLLPKSMQRQEIKIFNLIAKYAGLSKVFIRIPTTLIRLENSLYLIQNRKEDSLITCKECTEIEFFNLPNAANDQTSPVFVYKSQPKGVVVLFSYESASRLWSTLEVNAMIQQFIQSKADPATITRVLWRSGMKNKYYTITNRKSAGRRLSKSLSQNTSITAAYKRTKSTIGSDIKVRRASDFRYTHLMLPTSQSINNPFRISNNRTPIPRKTSSIDDIPDINRIQMEEEKGFIHKSPTIILSKADFDVQSFKKELPNSRDNKEYLVMTKDADSCYASETCSKIPEIENMVDQIVEFLNLHVFKKNGLKGIVLDFVKDKNNVWYLLECKEFNVDFVVPLEIEKNRKHKTRIGDEIVKRRSQSRADTQADTFEPKLPEISKDIIDENEEFLSLGCPFKIRTKPQRFCHTPVSEEEFLNRLDRVTEKIDKISNSHIPSSKLFPQDKNEQVQGYLNSHDYYSSQSNLPTHSYTLSDSSGKGSLDAENVGKNYPKKILSEGVTSLDDMNMKIKIAKLRSTNLFAKYGGESFWSKFILSFYNKVLSNEMLCKFFKNSKLQSFEFIVAGYFKLFNGSLNLELRKRLKASHYYRGITERDFDCYIDLFSHTMAEFNIEEEDRIGMISELRSVKNIICRELM
ncbi:unnamed protein product [Blepharisma stoltei]|uniref:Uncharacterized protein n=1 Tax=Blepharisma stoltei TaxID=1481888 RepID=A0AAU9K1A8_9CILI|nr:unnamed protein product [Blepharisma stoltei]